MADASGSVAEIAEGINVMAGRVTYAGVAEAFGLKHTPLAKVMAKKKN